jgi:hypothetical protein
MGLFNWIKGLLQPQKGTIRVNGGYQPCSHGGTPNPPPSDFDDHPDRKITRRRGSNPPATGNKPAAPSGPPNKPQPTGGRLIHVDRDPGPVNQPVPPRLPGDLADLPVLTAEDLDGAAAAPAPAETPSDELMERWKSIASHEWLYGGPPVWHRVALLAIAWARQQQAQSLQLPPPGADPVATDEDLAYVWFPPRTYDDARRALYARGRADERTAILRALGVEP